MKVKGIVIEMMMRDMIAFNSQFTVSTYSDILANNAVRRLTGLSISNAKLAVDAAVIDGHNVMLLNVIEDEDIFFAVLRDLETLGFSFDIDVKRSPELSMVELYEIFNNGDKISDSDIIRFHAHLDQSATLLMDLGPVYKLSWLRLRQDADTLQGYITARGL